MANGILSRLPDLGRMAQLRTTVESGLGGFQDSFGSAGSGADDSPIGAVVRAVSGLSGRSNIDLSALRDGLPGAIRIIQNALPEDSLQFIEDIERAYTEAQDFLNNSEIARQVSGGASLQDVALAVIADILHLFGDHLDQLKGGLIDPTVLQGIRDTFDSIDRFRADFPAHQADFLPFITRNLLGVSPDLLGAPLGHVSTVLSVLDPMDPAALSARLGLPRQAFAQSVQDLGQALSGLDPADPADYATLLGRLDASRTASDALLTALTALYQELSTLASAHAWPTLFSAYRTLLEAVPLDRLPSADDVVNELAGFLEHLLGGLSRMFGVEELAGRVTGLSETLRDTFLNSPLGQVRRSVQDFLGRIRGAIEGVPTGDIQAAVEQMLQTVHHELDSLGITQIRTTLEQAFADLESFVTTTFNGALVQEARDGVRELLTELEAVDLDGLIDEVTGAVTSLDQLIGELEASLDGLMDEFTALVSQLDDLSFTPVADEVIGEIDELKSRLQAINPNALSDVEKLALKGALAILQAIDLEGMINGELKQGFHAAAQAVKGVLGEINGALERLKKNLGEFDPGVVLRPVTALLDQVTAAVEQLNAHLLLKPVYDLVDGAVRRLEALSPGSLLDPLQGPYAQMMEAVHRIDPSTWVAPLRALYTEIDRLISVVDITPLMDTLEQRRRQLFTDVRTAILDALSGVHLPVPLDGFFGGIRTVIEGMTDAIFGDPDVELRRIGTDLRAHFQLSSLFTPLDLIFDQLIGMVETVPAAPLTAALNAVREGIGVGLDRLEPARILRALRQGEGELVGLAPQSLLSSALRLPAVKAAFDEAVAAAPPARAADVSAVRARFDAVFAAADPRETGSAMAHAVQAHAQAVSALRSGINALQATGAEEAYGKLRGNLDRLVPDFLRRATPLSAEDVLEGLRSLRPSRKAARLDAVLEEFLGRLAPLEAALAPAVNGFFTELRNAVNLINPLTLKDDVRGIYDEIRTKVRVLDPDELETSLRTNVFEPIIDPLRAIDPAALKASLDGVYHTAVDAVRNQVRGVLDDVATAVDEVLAEIRQAIQTLIGRIRQTITDLLATVQRVIGRVEELVFVELLGRLNRVLDNLETSFNRELDRVRNSFDEMLSALPV